MRFSVILFLILLITTPLHAQQWNWAVSAGGTSNNDHFLGIASDSQGNVYGVGTVRATADFGCETLAPGNSNGGFLAKYSASGECLWVQGIISNGIGAWIYDITIDQEDRIYIAGYFRSTTNFGSGIILSASGRTWFVARYDTDGNCEWVRRGGSTSSGEQSEAKGLEVDSDGTIYVTGTATGNTLTFAPITAANPNTNSTQLVVVAYDSTGDALWARTSTGVGYDNKSTNSIAVSNGRLFITGRIGLTQTEFAGLPITPNATSGRFYVLACDLQGNGLWVRSYGGAGEGRGIAADTLGNLFVAGNLLAGIVLPDGTLTAVSPSNDDILLLGFAQDGTYRWGKSTGSEDRDLAWDITPDNMGNAYMCGQFKNTIDFFGTTLTSAGELDVVIAKIEADGDVAWAARTGGLGDAIDVALTIHRRPVPPYTLSFGGYFWGNATYGNSTISDVQNGDGMLVSGSDTTFHVSAAAAPVCPGDCSGIAHAFVNGTAPFAYVWSDGNIGASITGLCVGMYVVAVTDADGNTQIDTVYVQEISDPEYVLQVEGDSLGLSGGSGWQWYLNGNELAGADTASLIAPQTGSYHALVSDFSGCTWNTDTVMVVLNVGIAEVEFSSIQIWPNPAGEVIYFQNPGSEMIHGQLLNGTGQVVRQVMLLPGTNDLDLNGLPAGIYLLNVRDGGIHRFVKE